MAITHRLIDISQPELWHDALNGLAHPPSHRLDYCSAISQSSNMQTMLYVAQSGAKKVVCPLSIRSRDGIRSELVSPYGFGGMVSNCGPGEIGEFIDGWNKFGFENGYVTAYVMQHPVFPLQTAQWPEAAQRPSLIYVMDLSQGIDALWKALSKNYRYEIRRFESSRALIVENDRPALVNALIELYPQTLARVGATTVYNFSAQTLRQLAHSNGAVLIGACKNGKIEAVVLFLATRWAADYFINAATLEGRSYSKLLVWLGIKALCRQKVAHLNLGGGVRSGDSLETFKRRFGAQPESIQVLRQVFNRKEYNDLCRRHGVAADAEDGFFPPYWKPVQQNS